MTNGYLKRLSIVLSLMSIMFNSASAATMPNDFVDVGSVSKSIVMDIRYFTDNNFVGTKVDGYLAPKCILEKKAAAALVKVQQQLISQGLGLKVFDCYRPQRAVSHFMRWAADLTDQLTKEQYYPNLDKSVLVGDYIAEKSGHSRGATLDLTLIYADKNAENYGQELDMGGDFDLFDVRSNTEHPHITAAQKANRHRLKQAMSAQGFVNYSMEWWHYSLKPQPYPDTYFDFVVR